MKKSVVSEKQMVKILRQTDHTPVAEVAKEHGVSDATTYAWSMR
jgi:putative transposase